MDKKEYALRILFEKGCRKVRLCKNCQHFHRYKSVDKECFGYCDILYCKNGQFITVYPEDFCPWGDTINKSR